MVYCQLCGLYMTSGFCLHGNVDAYLAAQQTAPKQRKGR